MMEVDEALEDMPDLVDFDFKVFDNDSDSEESEDDETDELDEDESDEDESGNERTMKMYGLMESYGLRSGQVLQSG